MSRLLHQDNKQCTCTPGQVLTMTNAELQSWYDHHGNTMEHGGKLWEPSTKRTAPNKWRVKFVESVL